MSRAIRRTLGVWALALLLAASAATAAVPAGPRLAVIKNTSSPIRATLLTVGPDGGAPMRLAGGQEGFGPVYSFLIAPISWSPDGSQVAFTGLTGAFLAGADGSGAHPLNVADAQLPVFAPDGHTVAFTRSREGSDAIWAIDLSSGKQRRLTPSRRGLSYFASSFSPDGSTLLATRIDPNRGGGLEVVALNLATGVVTNLLRNGAEPVYSPDGSRIALFREIGKRQAGGPDGARRNADLFVLNPATGALRRLTRTPYKHEVSASWDPSGERIAFTRFRGRHYEWANSIVQINADGSCDTEVISRKRTVFYGAAWQPGPGREAGPIDC